MLNSSCSIKDSSIKEKPSSLINTIQIDNHGFSIAGLNFGISEEELVSALNLTQTDFERKEISQTNETILLLHEDFPELDEVKGSGLITAYTFSKEGKFYRVDYQMYWNAKPIFKDDKWLFNVTQTDGIAEKEKAQKLLELLTEQYGQPLEDISLDKLSSPDENVIVQWYPLEVENVQGSLLANFYRKTYKIYDNNEIYGVDIVVARR